MSTLEISLVIYYKIILIVCYLLYITSMMRFSYFTIFYLFKIIFQYIEFFVKILFIIKNKKTKSKLKLLNQMSKKWR